MKYTIDRFEGEYAVVELESGKFVDVPREAIPVEARESDIIEVKINKADTEKRREEVRKLENDLFVD